MLALYRYCTEWCLSINISKTKVIIFNKTGKLVQDIFHIENQAIECVTSYKYLGIMLQASGKFGAVAIVRQSDSPTVR